jgi:nitrite reductase (NADH) small subunit
MSEWVSLFPASDIKPQSVKECIAGDQVLAVFRVGNEFFALDGICPHHGGPLGEGQLRGCWVACPWHGWEFNVTTGEYPSGQSLKQATFPTRIVDGILQVNLQKAEL